MGDKRSLYFLYKCVFTIILTLLLMVRALGLYLSVILILYIFF